MKKKYLKIALILSALAIMMLAATIAVQGLKGAVFTSFSPSRLLLYRDNSFLAQVDGGEKTGYGYWPVTTLPSRVVAATIALEDKRFRHHPGVDPIAVARALWQNIRNRRRISGASTIAMQVARLQNPGPRSYFRKAVEAAGAIMMTLCQGRENVLRQYLTIVPYGQNSHGIRHAARFYLDKPVEDLSWAEIAFLTAIPHAPGRMNPYSASGPSHARKRGRKILFALHERGVISGEAYTIALNQLAVLWIPPKKVRKENALHALFRLEKVLAEGSKEDSLLVRTFIDPGLQEKVEQIAQNQMDALEARGAGNMAVIVTRRGTREVLAWIGSIDYFGPSGGAVDYTGVRRSPGSTVKPFIYALGLDKGVITPGTLLDDLPACAAGFSNADKRFIGPLLPRQALSNSRNIPAVALLKSIGMDEAYHFLGLLGLHGHRYPAAHYGLGLALGALPVSLEQMQRAYGALTDDGLLSELAWFENRKPAEPLRVMGKNTARLITLFLSDPMARMPSFPRMGATEFPFAAAIKTGTSKGYRDAWAMAWSREYLVGVWTGRCDKSPMKRLGGAEAAAPVAREILLYLHKDLSDGMGDLPFPAPEGYIQVPVCARSGRTGTRPCEHRVTEWFPKGALPPMGGAHVPVTVDSRNGLLATSFTPEAYQRDIFFLNLPSRYDAWIARNLPSPPRAYSPLNTPADERVKVFLPAPGWTEETPVTITILSPAKNRSIQENPDTPPHLNTLALLAVTDPPGFQLLWFVDKKPFRISEPLETVRWSLSRGTHTFQAGLPLRPELSESISITVQ